MNPVNLKHHSDSDVVWLDTQLLQRSCFLRFIPFHDSHPPPSPHHRQLQTKKTMKTEPEAEEGSEIRVLFATFMEETAGAETSSQPARDHLRRVLQSRPQARDMRSTSPLLPGVDEIELRIQYINQLEQF